MQRQSRQSFEEVGYRQWQNSHSPISSFSCGRTWKAKLSCYCPKGRSQEQHPLLWGHWNFLVATVNISLSPIPRLIQKWKILSLLVPWHLKCSENVVKGRAILLFLAPLVYLFSLKLFLCISITYYFRFISLSLVLATLKLTLRILEDNFFGFFIDSLFYNTFQVNGATMKTLSKPLWLKLKAWNLSYAFVFVH